MSKEKVDNIAITLGKYFVENKATIRETASHFGLSKSTVEYKMNKVRFIDEELWKLIIKQKDTNVANRHIKGGESTRKRFRDYIYNGI